MEQKLMLTLSLDNVSSWADVNGASSEDILKAWVLATKMGPTGPVDIIVTVPLARALLIEIVEAQQQASKNEEIAAAARASALSTIPRERIELAVRNQCGARPTRGEIAKELLRVLDLLAVKGDGDGE